MKALFTVQEKIPAICLAVIVLCGGRPANGEFSLSGRAELKGKCEETERTA